MNVTVDILNKRYTATERLIVYQHSGDTDDAPEEVRHAIVAAGKVDEAIDATCGEWIIVVDDEVVITDVSPSYVEAKT